MKNNKKFISELQLGDRVVMYQGPYSTGTVTAIANRVVRIERPYGWFDRDCLSFTVGIERMEFNVDSQNSYEVI